LIDFVRIHLIEKPFLKWWDKVLNCFLQKFRKGDEAGQ
jgi:hypothetical protein